MAEFITQNEQASHIAEALNMLKSWNDGWQPRFWMTDYSAAEQLALKEVFPGCTVYLCDFHREQAWGRWVRSNRSGLSKSDQEVLLSDLRSLAWAPPGTSQGKAQDHLYRVQEGVLKQSELYKQNKIVRDWLDNTWLSCPEVRILIFTKSYCSCCNHFRSLPTVCMYS